MKWVCESEESDRVIVSESECKELDRCRLVTTSFGVSSTIVWQWEAGLFSSFQVEIVWFRLCVDFPIRAGDRSESKSEPWLVHLGFIGNKTF